MGLTATYTKSTTKRRSNSSPARSSNNIFKNQEDYEQEIEVEVLRKLDHPNIIKVEDIIFDSKAGRLYIVMEQGKKNITEIIEDNQKIGATFDESTIRSYMRQLLKAVGHMHEKGYFHRDLKPENMILVDDDELRLIDFGTCMKMDKIKDKSVFNDYVSTRWYRAPECILKFPKYDEKVDVFAIGCIMAEFYRMWPAFWGKNAHDQFRIYWNALGFPDKSEWPEAFEKAEVLGIEMHDLPKRSISHKVTNAWPEAIKIMDQMLSLNPANRPDVATLLQHPFFTDYEETSNPFKSPVRTPDKTPETVGQDFVEEPSFGGESIPSFGSLVKDNSPNKPMDITYSPVNKNDILASGWLMKMKKSKSLLNEGDSLPLNRKFSYSHDKNNFKAKPVAQSEFDGQEMNFQSQFRFKSERDFHQMDDEITNTDTAIDWFGDRSRKNKEEGLPSFGSLVNDLNKTDLMKRKSQMLPQNEKFWEFQNLSSNVFSNEKEHEEKTKNDLGQFTWSNEDLKGKFADAPGFGSFGRFELFLYSAFALKNSIRKFLHLSRYLLRKHRLRRL